ncbi:MAG: Eco57I restriction-modification methylase domain-containing protein, partial [Acidimicrobiales bacterium]
GLVRDKWLAVLMRELGFGRVPTTPAGGITADGRSFPVSHAWHDVPVHLLGWNVDLDKRTPGVPGAAERAPHAMVQELLNRSGDNLWATLSNGATLRLLRDSTSLVGQAYVEFDLAAMFDGEVFSDFAVLYLLCHESRFEPVDPEAGPEDCWLERWRANAVESGIRALGALRLGVQRAIEALGTGFVRHPANSDLRSRLAPDGDLSLADYHRSLLRLVYRLLFCFVAEDRGLLADPASAAGPRQRYAEWFSTARLRGIATRRRGTRHGDLWQALSLVLGGLGSPGGRPELGLPGLGGLFEPTAADVVGECQLSNEALLEALRHLCVVQPPGGGPRRMVDYRNLGAEELGGIYESLLEFVPRLDGANRTFTLESLVGNERKTSGAYYTPTSLIDCLLDSALDPLLDEAERSADPQSALLALTICDPACGSGHFLVAAARRIAARLARVRADGSEPTLIDSQAAMHDVVGRCIFGVDLNPMAAELAKVSLWLEALQPGRPLSFLDAHVKVGNALLGTTPALLAAGIPDGAFAALEGDDRKVVAALRKRNRTEREGQGVLFGGGIGVGNRALADAARAIEAAGDLSLADVALSQRRQRELEGSPELRRARLLADAWCAAFVIDKRTGAPELTQAVLDRWQRAGLDSLAADDAYAEVQRVAARFRFFHWHLEFPQVFGVNGGGPADGPGWTGGFSCVLGNPPWERVKLQEQEFFAARDPEIAGAPNAAARKKRIRELADGNSALLAEFEAAKRQADGESHLIRSSGRYPLCGRGDVNTYAVFAETDRDLLGERGRLGVILPTGIATDATTQHFFKDLVVRRNLASLYDFENRKPLFEAVDSRVKFCLLTLSGRASPVDAATFAFFAHDPTDLARPDARFKLTPEEITLLNPNTGTCPVFRSRRDAEITLGIYRRVPVLIRHGDPAGNPWGVSFMRMIDMSNDSGLFRTRADLEAEGWELCGNVFRRGEEAMLPLYEAKM